jgi:hypothetical protein
MSAPTIITCNLNCICLNADCAYKHFIQYKERKIVKKFYDSLPNKSIEETNNDTRKKNCSFGQLCENKNCGFRHRLSFASREKLIVSYKFNKICPTSKEEVKTDAAAKITVNDKINTNLFMALEDEEEQLPSVNVASNVYSGKSWVSVVKTTKEPKASAHIEDSSEDEKEDINDDDGFYMKF